MARAAKTNRVPRTRAGGKWTEAAFWGFIRAGLRKLSRRWPPIAKAALARRIPYVGPDPRRKWQAALDSDGKLQYLVTCDGCGVVRLINEIETDHVVPCGSVKSFADLSPWAERMFCEVDGLRVLCQACHDARSNEQKSAMVTREVGT